MLEYVHEISRHGQLLLLALQLLRQFLTHSAIQFRHYLSRGLWVPAGEIGILGSLTPAGADLRSHVNFQIGRNSPYSMKSKLGSRCRSLKCYILGLSVGGNLPHSSRTIPGRRYQHLGS